MKTIRLIQMAAALACAALISFADSTTTAPEGKKVSIEIQNGPKATRQTTYRWYKDGKQIKPVSPWLVFEHAKPTDTGSYRVIITDARGTVTSDVAKVIVKPKS